MPLMALRGELVGPGGMKMLNSQHLGVAAASVNMLARNLVGEPLVLKDLNSMWGQVDILVALCVEQKARVHP